MANHIRKGDTVVVTAGKQKGTQGTVLQVMPQEERVVVEGVNVRTKHTRSIQGRPGGKTRKEFPIHWSNVSPVIEVEQDGQTVAVPTRVRFEVRDGAKVRVAAKTGEILGDPIKKAR